MTLASDANVSRLRARLTPVVVVAAALCCAACRVANPAYDKDEDDAGSQADAPESQVPPEPDAAWPAGDDGPMAPRPDASGAQDVAAADADVGPSPPDAVPAYEDFARGTVSGRALLITWATDNPSDDQLAERLARIGLTVTSLPDEQVRAADVNAAQIIVFGANADSNRLTVPLKDARVPVVCFESYLFDDMLLTGTSENVDYGLELGRTIDIKRPAHPLAAGRSGTISVFSATERLSWGKPAPSALVIATMPNDPSRATIFAYPRGTSMKTGAAPAARVALFSSFLSQNAFTSDALDLFERAVRWAWVN